MMKQAVITRDDAATVLPRLFCGPREQFDRIVMEHEGRILGGVVYSAVEPVSHAGAFPLAWVALPVLGAESWYEVWISSHPVTVKRDGEMVYACDGHLLFGGLRLSEVGQDGLETMAYVAYSAIFDRLDNAGYAALLRVWNYFPQINENGDGLERYREFNVGRHEAFVAKSRAIGEGCVPAACALGTRQGGLVLGFLAGRLPGISIENPRQTNAYCYPSDFGPRSPTFSRGMLVDGALFISGTASIVGSKTMHCGDIYLQMEETLENLRVVIHRARAYGFAACNPRSLFLNVYLRHEQDYPIVSRRLDAEFDGAAHIVYLQADVCRADLLIEIEAFWMPEFA